LLDSAERLPGSGRATSDDDDDDDDAGTNPRPPSKAKLQLPRRVGASPV
jgi:hypothetical protein